MKHITNYRESQTPFVDKFSHLSLFYDNPHWLGIDAVHPRATFSTYQVMRPLLRMWQISDRPYALEREELICTPYSASERCTTITDEGGELGIET
jgi:hypothetical protein